MAAGPKGLSAKYCVEPSGKAVTCSLNDSAAGAASGAEAAGETDSRAAQPDSKSRAIYETPRVSVRDNLFIF